MNTTPIENFAKAARRDLRQHVRDKAAALGIGEDGKTVEAQESGDVLIINGIPFPAAIRRQRDALISRIKKEGFGAVGDAMAYTLFNRFCALRFMEANGYLPQRVFSTAGGDGDTPDVLRHALEVIEEFWPDEPALQQRARKMKVAGDQDNALYSLLLNGQCNALSGAMPFMFRPTGDFSELLMPENLLNTDSFVRQLVAAIPEDDWKQIEIVGWLYQFYIAEKKDEVMGRKKAVPKEDIPAVTQLFTPHWIVRYLVENSLGRLWLLNRPESKLREHMPYYIEGDKEDDFLKIGSPEEIRLLDPAVGSGHILVYAFDLLYRIYEEDGHIARDIPRLILEHNLYGVEIDERAAALASFALMMKARERDPRYLRREKAAQPQVCCLQEIRWEEGELKSYIEALGLGDLFNQPMLKQLHQFEEAKNFGSLIQPCLDGRAIGFAHRAIEAKDLGGQLFLRETHRKVLRVLDQAELLTQRYHVVVANPPYMGRKGFNASLAALLDESYSEGRSDLMTAFILRGIDLVLSDGALASITLDSWMFLTSYLELRLRLIKEHSFSCLMHIGWNCFPEGHTYNRGVAFVVQKRPASKSETRYLNLSDVPATVDKEGLFKERKASGEGCFSFDPKEFSKIPESPIAFWTSPRMRELFFRERLLGSMSEPKQGLSTTDNGRFVRFWYELEVAAIGYGYHSLNEAEQSGKFWFPFNKGGAFRKWYGNDEYVVRWMPAGNPAYVSRGSNFYFREGVTWGKVTSGKFSVRRTPCGFIFSDAGMKIFHDSSAILDQLTGILNSKITPQFLSSLSATINYEQGAISRIPYKPVPAVEPKVHDCIELSRGDWDNFETSWGFGDQPLLRQGVKNTSLEESWRKWESRSNAAFGQMVELETQINRLIITAYGLESENEPEVAEDQITLTRANRETDVKAFLSYAIGCMMGRYSLDQPGLILANQGETVADYLEKIGKPADEIAFPPDEDAIVPVLDEAYFDDDCTVRIVEFLKVTFGEDTLKENLRFIADALGIKSNETPLDALRRYLATKFYKDHLNTKNRAYGYKNRPIYWMVTSGKERAFQALIYLHRYTPASLSRLRTGYLHPLQNKLRARVTDLEGGIESASSTGERNRLTKQLTKLKKQQVELTAFDEELHHYADMRIELDLDDGVKHNYGLFGNLLADKKAVTGKK